MEKSITSLTESLDRAFRLSAQDWNQYSPLTLAYIGDAVYELAVRNFYVKKGNCQTQKLHRWVTSCVSAKAQARIIEALQPSLTQEEAAVYRRGRNSKPYTKAKNASLGEYLEATGFEAVIGWLYLRGDFERLGELAARGLEVLGVLEPERRESGEIGCREPERRESDKIENQEPENRKIENQDQKPGQTGCRDQERAEIRKPGNLADSGGIYEK